MPKPETLEPLSTAQAYTGVAEWASSGRAFLYFPLYLVGLFTEQGCCVLRKHGKGLLKQRGWHAILHQHFW